MRRAKANDKHPKLEALRNIGIYIRVSTEEQAQNPEGSIKNQEERLKDFVRLKNAEAPLGQIRETYVDRARSGKDMARPELQRLLSDIREGHINMVAVSELSRLSRSIKDFSQIYELMQKYGCAFLSLRESFDTTTAAGEMVLYTVANIAQFERKTVSERVRANMISRASRGLYNGGSTPIGYMLDPEKKGHLIEDPQDAEIVRAAFAGFLDQGSLSSTARWLNKSNYKPRQFKTGGGPTKRLGFFTNENLHLVLRNKAYTGIREYADLAGKIQQTPAAWPALISPALFDEVNARLKKNHCVYKPHSPTRYPYLLSSILYCGKCGCHMSGKSANGNGGKIPYYEHGWATRRGATMVKGIFKCTPHRVLARNIEQVVLNVVRRIMSEKSFVEGIIERSAQSYSERHENPDLRRVRKKVQGYTLQLEALAERLSELPKNVSAAPIFSQMAKIETARSDAEVFLKDLEKKTALDRRRPASLENYEAFIAQLKRMTDVDQLEGGSRDLRPLIQELIHKVEVFETEAKVYLKVGETEIKAIFEPSDDDGSGNGGSGGGFSSSGSGHSRKNSGSMTLTSGA